MTGLQECVKTEQLFSETFLIKQEDLWLIYLIFKIQIKFQQTVFYLLFFESKII